MNTMPAKQANKLAKDFATLLSSFAQVNNISIRDTQANPDNDAIEFHVVLAPAASANEPMIGRQVKVDQTEAVIRLLTDLHEPEARTLMSLYENGRLMLGSSPYLRTRGWAGRVVGRAVKTRMLEVDVSYLKGDQLDTPARQRHYADPAKILVPADCGLNGKVKVGDRVWSLWEDGQMYRTRILRIKGSVASMTWLDFPEDAPEDVIRSHVYVPIAR